MDGDRYPGGYAVGSIEGDTLFLSEPVPTEFVDQHVLATGACMFEHPFLMSPGGPHQSPPLRFAVTERAVWTFNIDGSLYERIDWDSIHSLQMDQSEPPIVRWRLRGAFVDTEFRSLRVEPTPPTAFALIGLLKERGVRITLDMPPSASN